MAVDSLISRPCVLIVLDGWGIAAPSRANAITSARTPYFNSMVESYPTAVLQASGEAAGLPWSEVGNSEVGHMSIGAGRIIYQDLSRINNAISDRSYFQNEAFLKSFEHTRTYKSALHIIGMVSTSGVHSHSDHLFALCELVQKEHLPRVFLHLFLDGRDAAYASGLGFIHSVEERIADTPIRIASLSGRRYAMDRDNHWDRTERAFRAIADGKSDSQSEDPQRAIEESYARGVYDEEYMPTVITHNRKPRATIADNDALIFFNIRAERARQLLAPFVFSPFSRFPITPRKNLQVTTMTHYDDSAAASVAFPPQAVNRTLSECISNSGRTQLHVAETEKYAHITYFLNCGREDPLPGEQRIMIPSPHVESYADKPEMGALEITDAVVRAVGADRTDFIAVNFANADMVGHTGNYSATVQAIEILDRCMKRIGESVLAKGGCVCITADHGNAESLFDLHTGHIDKEHSNNPVPCIIIAHSLEGRSLNANDVSSADLHILEPHGMLSDVAPTLLALIKIDQPAEMTGKNLLADIL